MMIVKMMIIKKNQKPEKNITKQLKKFDQIKASENLLDKQVSDSKKILELSKKYSELNKCQVYV